MCIRDRLDNAQPIVQHIADYMDVPVGKIKKLASDGAITAEVIKNAMFAAADETNDKFSQMPVTFSQVADNIRNQALMAFQPALQQLSAVAQTTEFQDVYKRQSLSPTNEELANGENWTLVNNGGTGAGLKVIDHKAIPIARIISRG